MLAEGIFRGRYRIALVSERLEIAWFRFGEFEPYQIRYLYNMKAARFLELQMSRTLFPNRKIDVFQLLIEGWF